MPSNIISNLVNRTSLIVSQHCLNQHQSQQQQHKDSGDLLAAKGRRKRRTSGDLIKFYSTAIRAIEEENLVKLHNMFIRDRRTTTGSGYFLNLNDSKNRITKQDNPCDCLIINDQDEFDLNDQEIVENCIKQLDGDTLGSILLKLSELNPINGANKFDPNRLQLDNSLNGQSQINYQLEISMELINLGCNVNFKNPETQTTALMMAARNNNSELLQQLLSEQSIKVNLIDKYGWTALFYATYFGNHRCCQLLLDARAYVDLKDFDKMNCLIWAAGRGFESIVELLIEYGALVNDSDAYNTSALIWACRKGSVKIVEILLNNGAQLNETGMYGWTPLIASVLNNHAEIVKTLLTKYGSKINLNACDGELMSALLIAAKEGFNEIGLELIRAGANINQLDKFGNTPLIYATMIKSHQLIEALIRAGASVEQVNLSDERNAIHWAIIRNDTVALRLFLEQNIDTKFKTSQGETYLMLAAKHSSWDVINLLEKYEFADNKNDNNKGIS